MVKAAQGSAKQDGSSEKATCGIIMPISAMPPTYDAAHWSDVRRVLEAAIEKAEMLPQIVSDSFESDVIQKRIIHNLYANTVVVCDVSGLNPNVMFELGIRITFKLPVIIITDDVGSIPFDTKIIEHLPYPRDLHIHQTNEFIDKLAERISRLKSQKEEGRFRSFIEDFGTFEVLEPSEKEVGADRLILERLDRIERSVTKSSAVRPILSGYVDQNRFNRGKGLGGKVTVELHMKDDAPGLNTIRHKLMNILDVKDIEMRSDGSGKVRFTADILPSVKDMTKISNEIYNIMPRNSAIIWESPIED